MIRRILWNKHKMIMEETSRIKCMNRKSLKIVLIQEYIKFFKYIDVLNIYEFIIV